LGLISGRLTHVANQIKAICHAAKAKYETAGTNGNADTALIKHYRDNGWHDLADKLEADLKTKTGVDDPEHGTVQPRTTVGAKIEVGTAGDTIHDTDAGLPVSTTNDDPEYDSAIDGGPDDD